jgi:hypothetical protein
MKTASPHDPKPRRQGAEKLRLRHGRRQDGSRAWQTGRRPSTGCYSAWQNGLLGGQVDNEARQVNRLWIERLLAGKGEKPLRQRFGAASTAHCILNRSSEPLGIKRTIQISVQRLQITEDYREKIIEVMRNPAPSELLRRMQMRNSFPAVPQFATTRTGS